MLNLLWKISHRGAMEIQEPRVTSCGNTVQKLKAVV